MPAYQNSKVKGNTAELEVFCLLQRAGYTTALPFGENAPYDLIVESPTGKLYRLQVRWASWRNEVLTLNLRRSSNGKNYLLDMNRIDAFAAWDGDELYIFPVTELSSCRNNFSVRRAAPKNNQMTGVHLAVDYKAALHKIP